MAEDLALDLEELRQLQSIAKRPRVVSILSSEITNLELEEKEKLSKVTVSEATPQMPTPISPAAQVVTTPVLKYVTLGSFSWDQDNEKVKIYVFLEGVDQKKIEADFKPMSIDVKFHDVDSKNYRCAMPKLNKEIVPEKCKLLVKPKRVIIILFKASEDNWLDLHFKEDKLKPKLSKERDPMAGIMDLMKNMYEEGDEEMKRTIAKTWSETRSGKVADPLKGYR